jgi:tripartite-type tricarboxylate transporter receptor subunit TctC
VGSGSIIRRVTAKLVTAKVKALGSAAVREKLASFGFEPVGTSPTECAQFIQAQIARWAPVVKAGGVRAD